MIKTAFVAAYLLKNAKLANAMYEEYEGILQNVLFHLTCGIMPQTAKPVHLEDDFGFGETYGPIDVKSELFSLLPYVLYYKGLITPIEWASENIKKHLDIALELVQHEIRCSTLQNIDESLQDNEELARKAIMHDPRNFHFCSARLRDMQDLAELAVNGDYRNFQDASDRLRSKLSFVLRTAIKNYKALDHMGSDLKHSFLGTLLTSTRQIVNIVHTCKEEIAAFLNIIPVWELLGIIAGVVATESIVFLGLYLGIKLLSL